ncbi:MAG TPA: M48 family metalloprotease [Ruania sp.]|nr:M48 family metalloprotease [Ruania sp.]
MLPAVGALFAAAALLVLTAPHVLTVGTWHVHYPRTALSLWFGAFFGGCALALSGVVLLLLAAVSASGVSTAAGGIALTLLAWLSLGLLGVLLGLLLVAAPPVVESHRRAVRSLDPAAISREPRRGFTLVRLRSSAPCACATPGRSAQIMVSTALEGVLSPAQLQAVLAHEYAHLRYRHSWAVRIAEINARCLPRHLAAGPRLRQATLRLVELVADDAAARQAGAAHLANALAQMAQLTGDASLELRAERLTLRRWRPARRCRVPEPIRI